MTVFPAKKTRISPLPPLLFVLCCCVVLHVSSTHAEKPVAYVTSLPEMQEESKNIFLLRKLTEISNFNLITGLEILMR